MTVDRNRAASLWIRGFLLIALIAAPALPALADYLPPTGTGSYYDLLSPATLTTGSSAISTFSPYADLLNPASSGATQRPTLDVSYIGLAGLGAETGFGSALALGLTAPTKVGVFTGSARLVSVPATFTSLDFGTVGSLGLSFSKDVYPALRLGAGIGFTVGSSGGNPADWGLDLDLGVVHAPGDVAFLKDFRWGVALRDFGKGYSPLPAPATAFPGPFTPAVGATFDLVRTDWVTWGVTADLSFPSFQNVRLDGSTRLGIRDIVFLTVAGHFDLHEVVGTFGADPAARSLPITFGVNVRLRTDLKTGSGLIHDRGWSRSQIDVNAGAAPLQGGVWGFGLGANLALGEIDRAGPRVELTAPETAYVSPGVEGGSDTLELPVTITDQRYVKEYELRIADPAGTPVRSIGAKETLTSAFFPRLAYVETSTPVPAVITWDGKTADGTPVPDGQYTYTVTAVDDNGNRTVTPPAVVVVDNTPPQVTPAAAFLVFSPNGDNNKDVLAIEQTGSSEDLWTGTILDATGAAVRSWTWTQTVPGALEWDGLTLEGTLAPDGTYTYLVSSTDRAGNRGEGRIESIEINTRPTPVGLTIDKAFFSPNGDGEKDDVVVTLDVPVTAGVERWSLSIRNRAASTVRSYEGSSDLVPSITFDGAGATGTRLPEGEYSAELSVRYLNGNSPVAVSSPFTLDLTRPSVTVRADFAVFSPNGDGRRDEVTVQQESSDEVAWAGEITDATGTVVYGLSWRGRVDTRVVWNGRGPEGQLLPDGRYTYVVRATDRAGNRGQSEPVNLDLNTEDTQVFLSTDLSHFSPNADRVKDRIRILPQLRVNDGVREYELKILDASEGVVRSFTGRAAAPEPIAWDGLDGEGRRSPDGEYRAELHIAYTKGDEHTVRVGPFVLDTAAPEIDLRVADLLFSPDGDGRKDEVTVLQTSSEEDLWEAEIRDPAGATLRGFYWKGKVANAGWDGRDDVGNRVADGVYTYTVSATDRAGNSVRKEIQGIETDTRPTPVYVSVQGTAFSPNTDGVKDDQTVKLILGLKEGIKSWRLVIRHAVSGAQRTYTSDTSIPAQIVWDGLKGDGTRAPEGSYEAALEVEYLKGNAPSAVTTPFNLDVTPPKVTQTLTPVPFSPDEDGVNDVLTIATRVEDISAIERWSMRVVDPQAAVFASFAGTGTPESTLSWNGVSPAGVRAKDATTYRLQGAFEDAAGNATTAQQSFPVAVVLPSVQLALPPGRPVFSPEGDGLKDTFVVTQVSSPEKSWTGEMRDSGGRVIRTWTWGGKLTDLVWDGKDGAGQPVPDGSYTYVVRAARRADLTPEARVPEIRVDTRRTPLSVNASAARFSPNGDGRFDAVDVGIQAGVTDGVATWRLEIGQDGAPATRVYTGAGSPPTSQRWDGRTATGTQAPEGAYRATLTLEYEKGNRPTERTAPITVDVTAPRTTLVVTPRPFSPDGDGTDDLLTLATSVVEAGSVTRWSLRILDPTQQPFYELSGTTTPPDRITWNGLSRGNELVQAATDYPLSLSIEDDVGNATELKDLIPVDVLVIREGDRLKIRISSITFPPNLSDLSKVAEATDRDRNVRTLQRIAEVLNKFPTYRIRIEGHANSVYWNDATRAAREQTEELIPLSKSRAEAVKAVLVQFGVVGDRMTTAGLGGAEPIVPFRDIPNTWKNRRVEFVLTERG